MSEEKVSGSARIFTFAYIGLLVVLLIGSLVFLATGKDFVKPISFTVDAASFEYSIDEFAEYLNETGYMNETEYSVISLSQEGIEEARKYGDLVVLKWDNAVMEKDHPVYENWKKWSSVGNMNLEDDTRIVLYGLFGVSYVENPDSEGAEKYECLNAFPMEYSGMHSAYTVWDYTMDDLVQYFIDCGFFKEEDVNDMSEVGTENKVANSIDMIWWDVENLEEDTDPYIYWHQMEDDGYMYLYGQAIYVPVMNGPFATQVNAASTAVAEEVYDAFALFPMNYTGESSGIEK